MLPVSVLSAKGGTALRKKALITIAFFVVLMALYPVNLRAGTPVSASLDKPLRFSEKKVLDGVTVARVDTAFTVGPVTVSGNNVIGSPGAAPENSEVVVLWQGIEVGRGNTAPDGSFTVPIPVLLDGRISVLYGSLIPSLGSFSNVGGMVQGYTKGGVSASSSVSPPQQAFDSNVVSTMWASGTAAAAWLIRDLGREVEISEVRLWFAGGSAQNRWARVSVSVDGTTFTPVGEKSVYAAASQDMRYPTMTFSLPAGTKARWVKIEADSSYDWTALLEVVILGKVPLSEVMAAPEWTRASSTPFSGKAWAMGKYGETGLPWGSVTNWADAGAFWMGVPGTSAHFRTKFSVPSSTNGLIALVGDDSAVVWLDGVPVLSNAGTSITLDTPVFLAAGEHVLSVEASNNSGPGGVLVSVRTVSGQILAHSGEGSWECESNAAAWQLPGSAGDFADVPVVTPKNTGWTAGPDPQAQWIWMSSTASTDAPAGSVHFRRPFTLSTPTTVTLSVAVDNSARVWLDGVEVLDWQSYSSVGSVGFSLPAGDHVLAIEATNTPHDLANPAGLLVSMKDASGAVILRSGDSGWQTSGYLP